MRASGLYFKLCKKSATHRRRESFDERNQVIGIEIEDASTFINLSRLEVSALPIASLILDKGVSIGA